MCACPGCVASSHVLDCDEYHRHQAPKCCSLNCWCQNNDDRAPSSVEEAFGHRPDCNVWVDNGTSYRLDRSRPCTCAKPDICQMRATMFRNGGMKL